MRCGWTLGGGAQRTEIQVKLAIPAGAGQRFALASSLRPSPFSELLSKGTICSGHACVEAAGQAVRNCAMSLLLILVILILLFGGGGMFYGGGRYRSGGLGIGGVLLLILVILLVTGNLRI